MIAGILFYSVAAVAGSAAIVRAARLPASTNPSATIAQALALLVLTLTLVTMATTTQSIINRHLPDGGKFAGNILTLVAALASVAVTVYTRYPPEQAAPKLRHRLLGLLPVVAVMALTFSMPHRVPLTGSFDGLYVTNHELAVYTVAYAAYLGVALVDQTVLWWSFSRKAPRYFQIGLRLLAIGSGLGVGYAVSTLGIVVQRLVTGSTATAGTRGVCGSPFSSASCTVAVGVPAVVIMVVTIGVLACIISARFDNLARWTHAARSYHRLGPLWLALTTAHPELVRFNVDKDPSTDDAGAVTKDIEWRLARRYVEIRDAMLLLGLDSTDGREGLTEERPETGEALAILSALNTRQHHQVPVRVGSPAPTRDIAEDIDWLERVAAQYTLLTT